ARGTAGAGSWAVEVVETSSETSSEGSALAGAGVEGLGVSVHPNPVRGAAVVALTLPQPGAVAVSVYDVLGRRVAVLHEGPLGAGRHEVVLDGRGLASGLYLAVARVESAGRVIRSNPIRI